MEVTIAICTLDHAESLRSTLASIHDTTVPRRWSCELVVVDNGSMDNTRQLVESFRRDDLAVRYVFQPQRGLSRARNAALQSASGEIIIFTDDDVRVPENWIEEMCAPITSGQAQAVAGGVRIAPHLQRAWMTWLHESLCASTKYLDPNDPETMIGANMAFSREVLTKVPQFDTDLGAGALGFHEESLFSFQLKEAGFRIATALEAEVEHHFDKSRLTRAAFAEAMRKLGASTAYRKYHWEHEAIARPRAQAALWRARLLKWRTTKPRWPHAEGMPEWEAWMLWQYYINRYYVIERRRPRNYEKRGLVKLNHRTAKAS